MTSSDLGATNETTSAATSNTIASDTEIEDSNKDLAMDRDNAVPWHCCWLFRRRHPPANQSQLSTTAYNLSPTTLEPAYNRWPWGDSLHCCDFRDVVNDMRKITTFFITNITLLCLVVIFCLLGGIAFEQLESGNELWVRRQGFLPISCNYNLPLES